MVNSAPYLIFLACAAIHSIATAGAEALIPFYTKSLGASTALAGLPFVVNSVSRLFTDPVAGAISDRLGARFFLILALLIGGLFSLLAGAASQLTWFLFLWIFVGISESMFTLSIRKIAFEHAEEGKEGSAVGNVTTLYGIGNVLGPPIGGYLGSWRGPHVLFLIYALPLLVCALVCWCFPLISVKRDTAEPGNRSALREGIDLLSNALFLAGCFAMFYMFFSRWGATKVAVPLFVVEERGLTLADVGTMFGIAGFADIAGRYLAGLLSDRWGAKSTIQCSLTISGFAFALLVLAQGFLGISVLASFIGLSHGFLNVTTTTLAMEVAGPGRGGLALGLARCFGSLGSVVGPFLVAYVAETAGYRVAFLLVGVLGLGIGVAIKLLLLIRPARLAAGGANGVEQNRPGGRC